MRRMPSHQRNATPGVVKLETKITSSLPHREIDNVVLPVKTETELKTEGSDTPLNLKVESPSQTPAAAKRKLEYVDEKRQEPEDILITGQKQGKK